MKRIKSACLNMTVLFDCRQAYDLYKEAMQRRNTPFQILSEQPRQDGGWLVSLKKPYNNYDCGSYLDQ